MTQTAALRKTSLHSVHRELGARMVDFGGWDMPVRYSGILEEHHAVRRHAGLFDVSHMGEIEIRGPEALNLINHLSTNDASRLETGQAHYAGLLYEHGGFVDDILVHKVDDDHFFLCVNSSNQEKDYEHIDAANRWHCKVEFASDRYAQIAIQGPYAAAILQKLTASDLNRIRYYHFLDGEVSGIPARIARTGYTGEDGFEIYIAWDEAPRLWYELLEAGVEYEIRPCGLGARNTLRLEAAMALYGHEIGPTISPLEANLGWIVKMDKGDFMGRDALLKQQSAGLTRKLAGFEMTGREVARDGYDVHIAGAPSGWVTSGAPSPTLGRNIGLCYLPADQAVPGRKIEVIIRNQPVEAVVTPAPFYKRPK